MSLLGSIFLKCPAKLLPSSKVGGSKGCLELWTESKIVMYLSNCIFNEWVNIPQMYNLCKLLLEESCKVSMAAQLTGLPDQRSAAATVAQSSSHQYISGK